MITTESAVLGRREGQLRRAAREQGFQLVKFRGRNSADHRFGTYMLIDPSIGGIAWADFATGQGYGLDLDDVAEYLARTA